MRAFRRQPTTPPPGLHLDHPATPTRVKEINGKLSEFGITFAKNRRAHAMSLIPTTNATRATDASPPPPETVTKKQPKCVPCLCSRCAAAAGDDFESRNDGERISIRFACDVVVGGGAIVEVGTSGVDRRSARAVLLPHAHPSPSRSLAFGPRLE